MLPPARPRYQRLLTAVAAMALVSLAASSLSADAANEPLNDQEQAAIRAAADRVADSVVQIRTVGGLESVSGTLLADGPTTGLIVSEDGFIVSSAFNFVQQPSSIIVTLATGHQAPAELIATDHSRMLVLLRIEGVADLPVAEFAPADEIQVGQWAIAVGRTFRADRVNLSVGIVSALNRMFGKVLQTDAAASTANYGGPLVDIRGRVLGVLVPMAPQATTEVAGVEWYDSGIGFAVPLAGIAERFELMKKGEDQHPGLLGVGLGRGNPHLARAELAVVRPDGPAGRAGLQQGDRIVEIDGRPIKTQTDLRFALGSRYGGETVRVVAARGDEMIDREIALVGELPPFRHAFLGILPLRTGGPVEGEAEDELQGEAATDADAERGDDQPDETTDGTDGQKGNEQEGENGEENQDSAEPESQAEKTSTATDAGIVVRMAYEGSPAAEAGVAAGDRLLKINETDIASIQDAILAMNNQVPGGDVTVAIRRGEEELSLAMKAGPLPTHVPARLPPAADPPAVELAADNDAGEVAAGEQSELKLPEFSQACQIYVPASRPDQPLGVLLWLHAPGASEPDQVIGRWRAICDRDGLLLVVPSASDPAKWERTELEYLSRLMATVASRHTIDPHRVVVYGEAGGGSMAYLMALAGRDLFRGVATSAAPLPRQVSVPANEPSQRLAIFAAVPTADPSAAAMVAQGLRLFVEAGYPVTTLPVADSAGVLSEHEAEEIARWIDTLDRF